MYVKEPANFLHSATTGCVIYLTSASCFFRSRLAQFQYDCEPSEMSANGCKQGNYGACLLAYTGLIGMCAWREMRTKRGK